ncbi:hypothetical protein BCR43DRAFT_434685 [Syncephalastrum racemosum]|uniref:Uncharacterized protein n=1 Tax=Syncephalastrum racemosum TaxID=13706 RepID=A0A1X2HQR1_SYNRA|nr:hypothetical protein BCR43DRAFT_434685 [Syncephalastrum racemosum]
MVTYRTNPVQLRFVDGLGYDDKDNERLVAEMSGGANIDNGQHAADDTLKVIHSLTCILKADARNCPRASISTFKKLKAFGVQTVQTTMILSEMYIDDDLKFVYKESRKAIVPRNYGQRQKQFAMAEMLA